MCGSLDKLTNDLEDLEALGIGRMKGEASPFQWGFRWDLDQLWETVVDLLSRRSTAEELELISYLYDSLAAARYKVRQHDAVLIDKAMCLADHAAPETNGV